MSEDYSALFGRLYQASDSPSKDLSRNWIQAASPNLKQFQSNEKTGKWCIFASPEDIDAVWLKIEKSVKNGDLLLAKVSTAASRQKNSHVVCVYTLDWSNQNDLQHSREVLKSLGFTEPLKYKRDIETKNRVYGGDKEYFLTM